MNFAAGNATATALRKRGKYKKLGASAARSCLNCFWLGLRGSRLQVLDIVM